MAPRQRRNAFQEFIKTLVQVCVYMPVYVWVMLDFTLAWAAFLFAHWASPMYSFAPSRSAYDPALFGLLYALFEVFYLNTIGFYHPARLKSLVRILLVSAAVALLSVASISIVLTWTVYGQIGRYVMAYTFISTAAMLVFLRVLIRGASARIRRTVVYIGNPKRFVKLKEDLRSQYHLFFSEPVFLLAGRMKEPQAFEREMKILAAMRPSELIIEDDKEMMKKVMDHCLEISASGCLIRTMSDFNEGLQQEVDLELVDPEEYIYRALGTNTYYGRTVKRMLDILIALVGLAAAFPVLAFLVVLIRITSRGPALYRQARVGKYGRTFTIHKLRTMVHDAEKNGAVWAEKNDPRATWLGGIMRKTRLDELPQLWNILRGEMSFVGPRPERPEFIEKLEREIPGYSLRHLVAPGLTGWAQILFRYGSSKEDARRKLGFDLFYVRNYSFTFDVAIILRTLLAMARGSR